MMYKFAPILVIILLAVSVLYVSGRLSQVTTNTNALADSSLSRLPLKFLWVGRNKEDQFTDSDLKFIASKYDLFVFSRLHGKGDRARHHEAARRLKELNPNIKILAYFPTSYRHDTDTFGADTFKDDFYLKDARGNKVPRPRPDDEEEDYEPGGYYVDLANQEYRDWVVNTLFSDWFAQASYDGIAFDNSNPINPDSARFSNVVAAIGQDHVARWNKGMTRLHKQLHKKYPGKIVLFNGVAPKEWKPNRSLELFSEADMALHENFCWDRKGPKSEESILDDVKLIQTYAAKGKTLLYKTNHPLEWNGNDYRDEIDITGKYCLGAFLLGYEPGYAYYKFGYGYGVSLKSPGDEIRENAPRIEYAWGNPEGKYSTYQGVYRRKFQNAWVVVNLSNSDKVITMWRRLQTLNGERTLEKDSKNTIHARTAEFFR